MQENWARQAPENRRDNSGYVLGRPRQDPAFWLQTGKFDFLSVFNNTPNTIQTSLGKDMVSSPGDNPRTPAGLARWTEGSSLVMPKSSPSAVEVTDRVPSTRPCRGRKFYKSNPGILRSRGLCSRPRLPRPETSAAVRGPGPRDVVGRGSRSPSREGGGKGPRRTDSPHPCRGQKFSKSNPGILRSQGLCPCPDSHVQRRRPRSEVPVLGMSSVAGL